MVKIFDDRLYNLAYDDGYLAVKDEEMFLTEPSVNHHPNLVKLIGYCLEELEVLGVVYDINPLDTVHNLTTKDSFTWLQRIKVALGFARLLEFLHGREKPYLVRNIDAAHIILDQEYNPRLFDFGLMIGGIFGEVSTPKERVYMSLGYVDPYLGKIGGWLETCRDVFSFGVVLLELISKTMFDVKNTSVPLVDEWARAEYKPNCSLVHKSLVGDCGFYAPDGPIITELAMRCVEEKYPKKRPTMKEVVKRLEGLLAVQSHGDAVGK